MRLAPVLLAAVLLAAAASGGAAATQEGDTVTLTVTVVDKDGDTTGDVTITASWDGGSTTASTASNGKAFIDVPEGADVDLDLDDETYTRNVPKTVEDASDEEVRLEVTRKGSVRLTVTDGEGGLEGVSVAFAREGRTIASGETDADGVYTTGTIERREYRLTLSKPGYYRNTTTVVVTGDVFKNVDMVRGTVNVEVHVRDDHFSPAEPVSDARVTVSTIGTQRTTSGTVTFTVPVNDDYRINATKSGYQTAERLVSVLERPQDVTLTIQRKRAVLVRPVNDQVVVGQTVLVEVVNAYEEPISGARVRLDGEAVGETNDDGEIRVRIESAGEHTIRARSGSLQSTPVEVTGVEARGDETATPTLSPTDTDTATATAGDTSTTVSPLPGFTVASALAAIALSGVALLARRRT